MKRWKKSNKIMFFRVEKVLKREDDKAFLEWAGHDSSFNNIPEVLLKL